MKKFIIFLILTVFSYAFADKKLYYKVLYKDGTVKVIDISKISLKTLSSDPNVVYYEPPKKLKLMLDVASSSSVGVSGSSNQTFTLKTYTNQKIKILKFPSDLNLTTSGSCSLSGDEYQCSDGILSITVNYQQDWRVIILSTNRQIKTTDLSASSYYIGTNATTTGKTGKNTVVAVIDTGIDFCHPMFKKSDGTSRIIYYYEPSTGTEFDNNTINQKIKNNDCNYDYDGHGTHVAGILAGYDPNSVYTGIAKESDIIVVRTNLEDTDVIQGLQYLKNKKQQLNKPMVVNMSLGFHYGPHDGTSLLEKAIQNLSSAGFIVVASAGNEGDVALHAKVQNFSSKTSIDLTSQTGDIIDGWYKGGKVNVEFCKGTSCISAQSGSNVIGDLGNCEVSIDNTITSSPLNGDGEFVIDFYCDGTFRLNLEPAQGNPTVDIYFAYPFGDSQFLNYYQTDAYGGYLGTLAMPGTSDYVITVGAITSKPSAFTTSKSFIDLGKIAYFSSRGPTRDGRVKPDFVAPGYFVYSALAGTSTYISKAGTSMSSPVVAGLVALILQDNPNIDVFQAKEILKNNVLTDQNTQNLPNYTYGYGKAALQNAMPSNNGKSSTGSNSSGGGGCSTVKTIDYGIILSSLIFIIIVRNLKRRFA
ncbi:S8 family serine peptidase [Sulfurihydrogenibium subterraneum]|uniref:S8 family serine peptidase n=1 Tax=Sulfurihydrogenibium subterraneum TaxID=171121 RepID=UPI000491CCDE|nr:S8 family serine peptidase [Sulfurihydrogenibium subterraneum]